MELIFLRRVSVQTDSVSLHLENEESGHNTSKATFHVLVSHVCRTSKKGTAALAVLLAHMVKKGRAYQG